MDETLTYQKKIKDEEDDVEELDLSDRNIAELSPLPSGSEKTALSTGFPPPELSPLPSGSKKPALSTELPPPELEMLVRYNTLPPSLKDMIYPSPPPSLKELIYPSPPPSLKKLM